MKRFALVMGLTLSALGSAAPECIIDAAQTDSTSLLATISGSVKGFELGVVYVTVTNGDKKYTTSISRDGKWALLYAPQVDDSQVLCWQGFGGDRREARGHR